MKLFDRFKNETTEPQTIGTNPTISELNRFFNTSDITQIGSSLTAATYYACMLIRCNAIAKLPIKIKKYTAEKGSVDFPEHALYDLLRVRPNPFTSAHDFMWATEFQRLEYGNAFWVKEFKGGKITGLYLLNSKRVSIMVDDIGILDSKNSVYYVYNDPVKGEIIYLSDSIAHFKNFPIDSIRGTSIQKYLYTTVQNEQYAQNVTSEKYKNGLQDPLIVQYTGDIDEGRQNKIKVKFAKMGGVKNAGKVIPIPSDFKVEQLETKLVNSQFFEMQGLTTRQIANAFGVKSFQLNDMEKSTYNNIEQQNRAFYSDTLQNPITQYEQEIDYKLLFKIDRDNGIYSNFNVDALLRSDILTRYQAYQIGINTGFKQIAEVRAKEGDPFVAGTDKLIIGNGASIPLEDIGKQYAKGGE